MNIKSAKQLVEEANKVKKMSPLEVQDGLKNGEITLIDIRDIRELWKEGTIKFYSHSQRNA